MKSNVRDLLELAELIYIDASAKCVADVSDLRDLLTIRSRVKEEGLSFLTITMPQFCRHLERCLATGAIDPTSFPRWKKIPSGSGAVKPAFLQGFTDQLFDRETGKVTNYDLSPKVGDVSSDISTVLESVRQICLTFKQVEIECSTKRRTLALENFKSVERELEAFSLPKTDLAKFLAVSVVLWSRMVVDFQPTDCIPEHGPGNTAEHISGNRKYVWRLWHDRLEHYFPLVDNGYPLGIPMDSMELKEVTIVQEQDELPVRVVTVPKTLKGPRVIAIEPCCNQYVQHGLQSYLTSKIGSNLLAAGHINFNDQSVNQELAMISSNTGRLATIDLSDASDRVPRDLALGMFDMNPLLRESIDACRSTMAKMPDGTIIGPLRKFASMGSALCFPVEAMYFYTVCVVALLEGTNLPISRRNVFHVTRDLYVYGDDILVPSTYATIVLDYLQKYNCKVNTEKTFVSGNFRESCGVDAYLGYPVTPVYLRHLRPKNKSQVSPLISWTATSNSFYKKGYWRTAQFMRNKLERILGDLPYVPEESEALGRHSFLVRGSYIFWTAKSRRWNPEYHRLEIKAWCPKSVDRIDPLSGYAALTKCFLGMESVVTDPVLIERSLEHSPLRGAVALQRHWVSAS